MMSQTSLAAPVAPEELAARLAARLCHDIMSPLSAIAAGLDFLGEAANQGARDEATELLGEGVRGLTGRLAFYRLAFGHGAEAVETGDLKTLAATLFADRRPRLDWQVEDQALPSAAARVLLNLVQIAAETLAVGGVARVATPGRAVVRIEAIGPRARLQPETRAGLAGEALAAGLGGRWAQARFVRALVDGAGGELAIDSRDEVVVFTARLPAP